MATYVLDLWGVVSIVLALFVGFKEDDTYVNVAQSAFIASLCAYSQMHSAFDAAQKVFGSILLNFCVGLGGMLAGVVYTLAPQLSIGLELGVAVFVFISNITYLVSTMKTEAGGEQARLGQDWQNSEHEAQGKGQQQEPESSTVSPANQFYSIQQLLCFACLTVSVYSACSARPKLERYCKIGRQSLIFGLLIALGFDLLVNGGSRLFTLTVDSLASPMAVATYTASAYADASHATSHQNASKAQTSGASGSKDAKANVDANYGLVEFVGLWAGLAIWRFVHRLMKNDNSTNPLQGGNQHQYTAVDSGGIAGSRDANSSESQSGNKTLQQRTFSYPDTLEFNFFDPDNLHEMLTPYAEIVFPSVQLIAKLYGFQVDSSRNQAEHLLMLLTNESASGDIKLHDAPQRIHVRMFSNYCKWCTRMNVEPQFSQPLTGRKFVGYIEDMLFFLLIWGEAANLRHMPECLCFIFHKTLVEHKLRRRDQGTRYIYPGYFLDMIVTPIYEVVAASLKTGGDHEERKTYDDFNEFFWSSECLTYYVFDELEDDSELGATYTSLNTMDKDGNLIRTNDSERIHICRGMAKGQKTYLEKRSWFHALYSVHRIFEWHVLTFTLIAVFAFSVNLQWSYSYTFQIASVILWLITFMGIFWTCLEVWTLYPGTKISTHTILGYVLRIVSGYLVLACQTVYYHWSFHPKDSSGSFGGGADQTAAATFWWWQYLWLSLFSSSAYFLQSLLCYFPKFTATLLQWDNAYFQALLNICDPSTELFVGKGVPAATGYAIRYIPFWISLFFFKFWFGYTFILAPICQPTLELYDDYMNYQQTSFLKTCVLVFVLWMPHFLVYLIDLSIFYSCWSSGAGAIIALIERQGAVRDMTTLRGHFMRSPAAFCQKLMPTNSYVAGPLQRNISTDSISSMESKIFGRSEKIEESGITQNEERRPNKSPHPSQVKQQQQKPFPAAFPEEKMRPSNLSVDISGSLLSSPNQDHHRHSYQNGGSLSKGPHSHSQSSHALQMAEAFPSKYFHSAHDGGLNGELSDLLDIRSMRWVVFSRAWNEIIFKLHITDHISVAEMDVLQFSCFDWLTKPVYLPLFQTAACVESTVHLFKERALEFRNEATSQAKLLSIERFRSELDVTTTEAVGECYELTRFVLAKLMGRLHDSDVITLLQILWDWSSSDEIFLKVDPTKVVAIAESLANIAVTLQGCISKRKSAPAVTEDILRHLREATESQSHPKKDEESPQGKPGADSVAGSTDGGSSGGMRRSVSTGFLQGVISEQSSIEQDYDPSVYDGGRDASGGTLHQISPHRHGHRKFEKLQPFRKSSVLTDHPRDKLRDDIRGLFNNMRSALADRSDLLSKNIRERINFILGLETGFLWDDVYASTQIDELARDPRAKGAIYKLHGLLKLRRTEVDPSSAEATRRINFFINSLFMDMPTVSSTRYSREYTCMTPFYSEDVLLSRADLESKNSDGISTLLYLQTLYRQDWVNFCDRQGIKDDSDSKVLWSKKNLLEIRMWASRRAQTLFRTVEGMMYTEAALRLVCELEELPADEINVLAPLKFNYLVACQVYGQQRKNTDSKADDIDFLLLRHPNLRVAYIDAVRSNHEVGGETTFYSVLIKHDFYNTAEQEFSTKAQHDRGGFSGLHLHSKEVYRIKLPGNAVLGEGKPENQNHAIIFSRGRYIQAMDMNQDGYFEEAFKMRNLLEEFGEGDAIVGFREHIFTGSVSSVANYMALQELSFVTLGQRVLYNPLRIRQHYGHPDVFDKMFVMTEGGMSKASRGINLSEDVFAGFNATIRGHNVKFKEYVQAGKGRDVGLQQTYKFEAKLAQGNAEQSLSRDMSRICKRLDFFRLMSFYYGGIGHYLANTMVMFTLVTVVYFMVGLAVFGEEGVNGRKMSPEGFLQMLLSGMGILQTLPLFVTLTVEKGPVKACSEILIMMVSGGPLYFIFHIQTKAYYFSQTLLAGGAMYRPTGRGFVTRHSPFDENYRFFASSHIYLGFDLLIGLIVFAFYSKTTQYAGLTWSLWMAVVAFLIGPFWFNPITFEWDKVTVDYSKWMRWMAETGGSAEQSWEVWWKEENAFYAKTTISWKIFLIAQKTFSWAMVAVGLFGTSFFHDALGQFRLFELMGLLLAYGVLNWILTKLQRHLVYASRRFAALLLNTCTVVCLIYLFKEHRLYVRYTIALYYLVAAVAFVFLLWTPGPIVLSIYKMHDYVVGHTLFVILGIMSTLQMGYLQTWLLYHNALSAGVAIEDVLKFARKNKEMGPLDASEQINELKTLVSEQERLLGQLIAKGAAGTAKAQQPVLAGQGSGSKEAATSAEWGNNVLTSAANGRRAGDMEMTLTSSGSSQMAFRSPELSLNSSVISTAASGRYASYGSTGKSETVAQTQAQAQTLRTPKSGGLGLVDGGSGSGGGGFDVGLSAAFGAEEGGENTYSGSGSGNLGAASPRTVSGSRKLSVGKDAPREKELSPSSTAGSAASLSPPVGAAGAVGDNARGAMAASGGSGGSGGVLGYSRGGAEKGEGSISTRSSLSSLDGEKAFASSFADHTSKLPPKDFTFSQPVDLPP